MQSGRGRDDRAGPAQVARIGRPPSAAECHLMHGFGPDPRVVDEAGFVRWLTAPRPADRPEEVTRRRRIDELNARGAALLGPVDGPRLARGREPLELPAGGFLGLPRLTTDENEELDMQGALRASATAPAEEAALRWA
jgi:hypothetical protein